MNRKTFLSKCTRACFFLGISGISIEGCAPSNYFAKHSYSENILAVSKKEFTYIKNDKSIQRKFVMIKMDNLSFPICLYRISENKYSALWMECTHNSCELHPHEQYLVCPCHGSEFSDLGIVQNPPAEKNLKIFQTNSDEANIYIHL